MHGKGILSGVRLLLTVDESTGSLAAARGLRAAGAEPFTAATADGTYVARSRTVAGRVRVPEPTAGLDAFLDAVAAAAAAFDVAAILPATEATMRALTGAEGRFPGVAVGTAPVEALERATDKTMLARLAVESGLRSPETRVVRAGDDLAGITYPAIVKPRRSVEAERLGKAEARRVAGADELDAVLSAHAERDWLLQSYVEGRLAAVSGVAWQGEARCTSHQVAHRIWPPGRGITSYGEVVAPDPHVDAAVRELVGRIGWSGVFQLQYVRARDGAYAIDFNPRVYGSTALAIAAGLNLPAIWAALVLGLTPEIGTARPGTRYRVEETDVRALAVEAAGGGIVRALAGALPRPRTTHAVFSLRDPAPFLTTVGKAVGRLRR